MNGHHITASRCNFTPVMGTTPGRTSIKVPFWTLLVRSAPRWALGLVAALYSLLSTAQPVFNISAGDVVTCGGTLVDSGGDGGPGYGNNESFTITICPDAPGVSITLTAQVFNLSAAGTSPGDMLNVYDGPTTGDPMFGSLGAGSVVSTITASFMNPTGCLTLEFISNETGTGTFAFTISCFVPCEPPTALAVMSEPSPAMICQGEAVQFDASGSSAAPGQTITTYIWDFGDGSMDSTSGALVAHAFPDPPAAHIIHLAIRDGNDCVNTNSVALEVHVSTTPEFTGMENQTVCVGESVVLDADASAVTWTGLPIIDFGVGLQLPDQTGIPFTSPLVTTAFTPGETMTDLSDIISVCIEMEHSWMDDCILQLTSPTGQTILLHNQGGGGTFLGEPVDDDLQPNAMGTCYQYCFSPTATTGTWEENSGGVVLPEGEYESVEPFSGLLGSEFNGTWTLTFTDMLSFDNGFICSWWINFDPSLLPDAAVYTPVLDLTDADSSNWQGNGLVPDPTDPTQATFTPTSSGSEILTFTVTDNFGCSYDTTLTITVTPAAVIDAVSLPSDGCGEPVQLNASLQSPVPSGPVIYQWTPAAGLSSTSIPYPLATAAVDTWYSVSVFPAGHPLCGSTDSVFVNEQTWLENDSSLTEAVCSGDGTGNIEVITTGNGGPWNYTWTDADGNVVQTTNGVNGDIFFGTGGQYTVVVLEGVYGNGCSDTLEASIQEPSAVQMLTISEDTTICLTGTATLEASAQGGSGPLTPHWNDGHADWEHSVTPLSATTWSVWSTDSLGCFSDTLSVQVNVNPALGLHTPDTVVTCPDLDTQLMPDTVYGGDGNYVFSWAGGAFQEEPGYMVNLPDSATIYVVLQDGCETPPVTHAIRVSVKPIPDLVLTADTLLGCDPFAVIFSVDDTTDAATVDWDFGDGIVIPGPPESVGHTYPDPGVFDVSVTVHWPNGCDDDTTVADMITVAAVPDAQFVWDPVPASTLDPTVGFVEDSGPYAVSWIWDFAGLDTAHGPEVEFTFPNVFGDLYPVELVVANYLGCTDTVVRMVEVMDEFLVFIPTAFTPNGDGINEQFFVQGDDIDTKDFLLAVFDRWGEKIFETTDRGEGWDGAYGGSPVQDGTYTWLLNARSFYTGKPHKQVGHVVVTR